MCAAHGSHPGAVAASCLEAGARLVQLRVKGGASGLFLQLADELVRLARPLGGVIVINDRPDIAGMAGAHGVHVGQDDLSPDAARSLIGAGLVGISTHDQRQVDEALETSADYLAVGPVHGTSTKDTGYGPRGLELVRYAAGRGKPVVAIGGITLDRAPAALAAGASAVAVISDVLATGDVEGRARAYVERLGAASGS